MCKVYGILIGREKEFTVQQLGNGQIITREGWKVFYLPPNVLHQDLDEFI